MVAKLGAGDMERGAKTLEAGIARGDINEKGDGFYYFKRVIADDKITKHWGQHVHQLKSLPNGNEVASQLELHDWSKYAFAPTSAESSKGAAASKGAMDHLQAAYDALHKCINNIRKTGMNVRKMGSASAATMAMVSKALDSASQAEKTDLAKMINMLVKSPSEMSDLEIKNTLKNTTAQFSSLMSSELELASLAKGLMKSMKNADSF